MASTKPGAAAGRTTAFTIQGNVKLEGRDACSDDLPLRAFAFDSQGRTIGEAEVGANGSFAIVARLKQAADVDVLVGPAVDAALVRQAQPPVLQFKAADWVRGEAGFSLDAKLVLPKRIWWPWWPIRVCVRGRVRKSLPGRDPCVVPFAKVEVYDVDREGCLWPILKPRLPSLIDRLTVRLPDLVKLPPVPDPIGPIARSAAAFGAASRLEQVALNPQPLPPEPPPNAVAFDPQPEPPLALVSRAAVLRVGEVKALPEALASRLQDLTLSSRVPPWLLWPRCFYSKAVVCQTETDCDGRFTCCFWWWPFHVRNGRLRFDARPDIVVKVTQTIDGVSRVIYLDPYTSTRWDTWGAYIDLVLDDEDVRLRQRLHAASRGRIDLLRARRQRRGLPDQPGERRIRPDEAGSARHDQPHGLRRRAEPARGVR